MQYTIDKSDNKGYTVCNIMIDGRCEYCYYEKSDNLFSNRAYFIIGNRHPVGEFLDNCIYVFCQGFSKIRGMIDILKKEFYYLDYVFILSNSQDMEDMVELVSELELDGKIILLEEYFKRMGVKNIDFGDIERYVDYDLGNDLSDVDKMNEIEKDYADYKGFNERFIDSNVKNIVKFKNSNGGGRDEL